jgi:hypothetical protein
LIAIINCDLFFALAFDWRCGLDRVVAVSAINLLCLLGLHIHRGREGGSFQTNSAPLQLDSVERLAGDAEGVGVGVSHPLGVEMKERIVEERQ